MRRLKFIGLLLVYMPAHCFSGQPDEIARAFHSETSPWLNGVGSGFRPGTTVFSASPALTIGMKTWGSLEAHHLGTLNLAYGRKIFGEPGRGKWYQGNFEIRGEFLAGGQFSPEGEWIVGIGPHLRYNFMTGTPFVPFIHAGAGVLATSIGPPDLSGIFEFHEQIGIGLHWFVKETMSISLEGRFIHVSCAGISEPNRGLNGVSILLGAAWYW